MITERLSVYDIRVAALAARLMLSAVEGRKLLGDLLGEEEAALGRVDGRLRQWLESSHLDDGTGLN